jgi:monovalent cation/proton antiporter MnhG/PhaG subunit
MFSDGSDMTNHPYITGSLLAVAVTIAIWCAFGLLIMRDAFQRLHFSTPVVSLSTLLIAVAVFLENSDVGARLKIVLICIILFFMNAVLSHATARAIFIRKFGHWMPQPKDKIPVHGQDAFAGQKKVISP